MLPYQYNAAAVVGLFGMYYVFNKITFDYLKPYHQISLEPDMEQFLKLLSSDIPSIYLPGLNIKILY